MPHLLMAQAKGFTLLLIWHKDPRPLAGSHRADRDQLGSDKGSLSLLLSQSLRLYMWATLCRQA